MVLRLLDNAKNRTFHVSMFSENRVKIRKYTRIIVILGAGVYFHWVK